jgi:hypothetical protein
MIMLRVSSEAEDSASFENNKSTSPTFFGAKHRLVSSSSASDLLLIMGLFLMR